MRDLQKDISDNLGNTENDFITCFLDLKDIELHKNSLYKMSRIETVLLEHLEILKQGVVKGELQFKHLLNIRNSLDKEKIVKYFPNLNGVLEEFFAILPFKDADNTNS